MGIQQFQVNFPGHGVDPRVGSIQTTQTKAQVTTAGYLNPYMKAQNFSVKPTDFFFVAASDDNFLCKTTINAGTGIVTLVAIA